MWGTILICLFSSLLLAQVGHGFILDEDIDMKFELTVSKGCNLGDLNLKPTEDIITCFPERDADTFAQEGSRCLLSVDADSHLDQNKMVLKQCVNGVWDITSLGKRKSDEKRFLGILAGIIIGCVLFCSGSGSTTVVALKPPTFETPCRPADLLDTYYVEARQDTVIVTWAKPTATDSDGTVTSITVTTGSDSGSEFDGSIWGKQHVITYEATDNDGLSDTCHFDFTVKKHSCEPAPLVTNGQRICDLNAELGSVCTYACNSGYELLGNSQVKCENSSSPIWTATPTCEKVSCITPPSLQNGHLSCTDSSFTYSTTCTFICNSGFDLKVSNGSGVIRCQANGTWSPRGMISCKDQTPPELSCLTPQIFYADRAATSTPVSWELPTALDEVDRNVTVIQTDGLVYGSVLQSGSSFVNYKAIDSQGNESPECTIEIRVEVTSCQHPLDVIQDTNMEYSCGTYMYGAECTLSCKFNLPLIGADLITCERIDPSNLAFGSWSWGNGTKPFCNQTDCPPLNPPVNGALAQDYIGITKINTMLCNDQFDIPVVSSGFTGMFICQNSGTWNPNIEVPDCVEPRNPRAISLPVEIFYYSGDCSDPATQDQIRSNVQQILEESVNIYIQSACQSVTNCTTNNLKIICGETTTRRKRRASIRAHVVDIAWHQQTVRRKRESPTLIVEFVIEALLDPSLSVLQSIADIDNLTDTIIKPLLNELFQNGTFNISTDIAVFSFRNDSLQTSDYGDIDCPLPGQALRATRCYPCPAGYFKNSTTLACELCPVGQFSDVAGLTRCIDCPEGTTTHGTGSKDQTECFGICPAGQVSVDGTLPCAPCRLGYYQSETGQTHCNQCTTGTTEFTGSLSSDACEAFQILIDDTAAAVNAGSLSQNLSDLTLMFWTKRYANLTTNASLRLTSGGNDVIIVNLSTVMEIQIPIAGFQMNVGSLTSSKWTHLCATWNTTDSELSVYINGVLQSGIVTLAAQSSPLISAGSVWMESTGSSGVYIADLHVEDAVVQASEIESVTESCWNDRPDDVFSLNDIRFTPLQGVTIQAPASCDPVDECAENPCNNHTCITGEGTYTCRCSEGWSGDNCTTPPDYCVNHGCVNEATCVNGNSGYTCSCVAGYSGDLCEAAPVDGGWSEWSDWTTCTATCDGGTQVRTRSCDSPEPSPYGNNCTGDAVETQACGQDTCPFCRELSRGFRMITNCTFDNNSGLHTCIVRCRPGYIIPPSLTTTEFTCGISTDYDWKPMNNPPDCVDPIKPPRLDIISETQYQSVIPAEDTSTAEQLVTDKLSGVPCIASSACKASVVITNPEEKGHANSTLTVTLTVEMTETGALEIQNYLDTSIATDSLEELIDAIRNLEDSASFINISSSSIFDITLNGETYTIDPSTVTFIGNVTCPAGETAINGVCASCPEGTFYTNGYCNFCERGTYTSTTGETTCTSCPAGFTTTTIGSYAASQCTVTVSTTTATTVSTGKEHEQPGNGDEVTVSTTTATTVSTGKEHEQPGNGDEDNLAMYIGLAVSGVALVVSLTVCGLFVNRNIRNRTNNNSTPQPTVSTSSHTIRYIPDADNAVFPNPSYSPGSQSSEDGAVDGQRQQTLSLPPYVNVQESTYLHPVPSPPPPYQEEDNEYADIMFPGKEINIFEIMADDSGK